jgi:hypothetical protein
MNTREMRQYEMLVRVRDFGITHGQRFPDPGPARQGFAAVDQAVSELTEFAMAQMAATRQTSKARTAARESLIDALEAVSRTARVIAAGQAGFTNTFQLPRRRPAPALLTAGRLFARDAAPAAALFTAHGMPENFVTDLTALVDRFAQAIRARHDGKGESAAARARIEAAISAGMTAARQLDVIVMNHIRDDVAATAAWLQDRRVVHSKARKEPAAAPTPVALAPAQAERATEHTPTGVSTFARKVS